MNAINNSTPDEFVVGLKVGSELKHWRKVKGFTQKTLARKMGSHQSAIARVEDDKYLPSISFLIRVAAALDKRIEVRFK
jgi:transcriptional regulator with XRE-family HTH domain